MSVPDPNSPTPTPMHTDKQTHRYIDGFQEHLINLKSLSKSLWICACFFVYQTRTYQYSPSQGDDRESHYLTPFIHLKRFSSGPGTGLCRKNTVKYVTGYDLKEPGRTEETHKQGSPRVAHLPLCFFKVGIIYRISKQKLS